MRLRRIEEEFDGRVDVEWRSFLLRLRPDPARTAEKFVAYTQSWLRPAAEPDSGTFRVWQGEAGPPSHSLPPHLIAKSAARIGAEAFRLIHERLLHAYFAENRDITDAVTLRGLWQEAGLPLSALATAEDPDIVQSVMREHHEAVELGTGGVPAVRVEGREGFVVGAQSLEVYRKWTQRLLAEATASS